MSRRPEDGPQNASAAGHESHDAPAADAFGSDAGERTLDPAWDTTPWGTGTDLPEMDLHTVQRRIRWRALVVLAVTGVALFSVQATWSEFRYFLRVTEDPIDLGDLRVRRSTVEPELSVPASAYVRLQNQVMTYEAESRDYEYFYCPLYHIITRTKQALPEKNEYRNVDVPEDLVWLVTERRAFAEDLTAGFSGEGRLLRVDQAPRWGRSLYRAYADIIRLPPEQVYLFLDGDTPASYRHFAIAYALAVLVIGFAAFSLWRNVRLFHRLRREIAPPLDADGPPHLS